MTRQSSGNDKLKEREEFSRRLVDTLVHTGHSTSPTQLALDFNRHIRGPKIHMHSCRKWLNGESIPTQEKLVVLARMLGVSPDWLRFGPSSQVAREPNLNAYVADPADLSLLASIQHLESRDKRILKSVIQAMLDKT